MELSNRVCQAVRAVLRTMSVADLTKRMKLRVVVQNLGGNSTLHVLLIGSAHRADAADLGLLCFLVPFEATQYYWFIFAASEQEVIDELKRAEES